MPADPSPPTIEAEVVVLPPDGKGKAPTGKAADNSSAAARIVAHWMDELFVIPGTSIRMGLDPIIGLFPGIGDALASSIGFVTLTEGIRQRVPLTAVKRSSRIFMLTFFLAWIALLVFSFTIWFTLVSGTLSLLKSLF